MGKRGYEQLAHPLPTLRKNASPNLAIVFRCTGCQMDAGETLPILFVGSCPKLDSHLSAKHSVTPPDRFLPNQVAEWEVANNLQTPAKNW